MNSTTRCLTGEGISIANFRLVSTIRDGYLRHSAGVSALWISIWVALFFLTGIGWFLVILLVQAVANAIAHYSWVRSLRSIPTMDAQTLGALNARGFRTVRDLALVPTSVERANLKSLLGETDHGVPDALILEARAQAWADVRSTILRREALLRGVGRWGVHRQGPHAGAVEAFLKRTREERAQLRHDIARTIDAAAEFADLTDEGIESRKVIGGLGAAAGFVLTVKELASRIEGRTDREDIVGLTYAAAMDESI